MGLYINGVNCSQFEGVYLLTHRPDMTLPYFEAVVTTIGKRLIQKYTPARNITPGSMELTFTAVCKDGVTAENFESFIYNTFNQGYGNKLVEIQLPVDTNTYYVTTLRGGIGVKTLTNPKNPIKPGYREVREYTIPLNIELVKKK